MSNRIKRLTYERQTVTYKLPVFVLERLRKEPNQTAVIEKLLMKHYGLEYP